jgi:DNA-damage-inducible protein D
MTEVINLPEYLDTMARLEQVKHETSEGKQPYWMAREIHTILGYPTWREFESVIERAREAFSGNEIDSSHQIVITHKLMKVGRGAQYRGPDYFLSRPACYLIALNGDPAKPEIAAAQTYFVIRTRESELREQDEKRIELRGKVAQSFRRVSGVAKDAGVRNDMQKNFHGARYHGLYGMSAQDVKRMKQLNDGDNLFDFAGPLELSANDFQMNLAADVLTRERISGEALAIAKNKELAQRVRKTMKESGATMPENLVLEAPIKEIKKRLAVQNKFRPPSVSSI